MAPHNHPVPKPGCYVPAVTFFSSDDTLCLPEQAQYYRHFSTTGLAGIVILGTNAETLLLTREERFTLLKLARASVPKDFPIIAGVSGHSTAQVKQYIADAYEAGADYALVLPCAYFGKQTTPDVVRDFFRQVAESSALPIIVYNFPAVCNGLDLDSEIIAAIARENENVVGVKLTCGSVAKITRLSATFPPSRFAVFGGQSDFLTGGLAAGSAGCIAAFANIFPRSVARVYDLWTSGKQVEARQLQNVIGLAESATKAGIANTKYAAAIFCATRAGVARSRADEICAPRKPYRALSAEVKKGIEKHMQEANRIEGLLAEEGKKVSKTKNGTDGPLVSSRL